MVNGKGILQHYPAGTLRLIAEADLVVEVTARNNRARLLKCRSLRSFLVLVTDKGEVKIVNRKSAAAGEREE